MIKLKQISTLVSAPDKKGVSKVIKRNMLTDLYIQDALTITLIEQIYNRKGVISKTTCNIKVDGEYKSVKHSPEYVINLIKPINPKVGFYKQ